MIAQIDVFGTTLVGGISSRQPIKCADATLPPFVQLLKPVLLLTLLARLAFGSMAGNRNPAPATL
jgi:hypothetical protein